MKKKPIKLTIVMPVWSPMRHALFQALAGDPGIKLKVLFEKEAIAHRPSWQAVSNAGYDWEIIQSVHPKFFKRYRLIPFRLPLFLKTDTPDVLITVSLTQAVIGMISVCFKQTKVILWTGESGHILSRRSFPGLVKLIRLGVYPFIDGFACYSDATRRFLKNEFAIPASKLFRIPQCTDNSHFKKPARRPQNHRTQPKGKYTFLIVGRLTRLKGLGRFIRTWQKLPPEILSSSLLRIAGTGPLKKELESLCSRNGGSNIRLVGFIDFGHLPRLYHRTDVLILPSLEDTWGFVINEAMAAGVPVLCSKYAHAREMVGENGYVFDPLNERETLSVIIAMYEKREQWLQMGRGGLDTVERHFSAKISAAKMITGIRKILSK